MVGSTGHVAHMYNAQCTEQLLLHIVPPFHWAHAFQLVHTCSHYFRHLPKQHTPSPCFRSVDIFVAVLRILHYRDVYAAVCFSYTVLSAVCTGAVFVHHGVRQYNRQTVQQTVQSAYSPTAKYEINSTNDFRAIANHHLQRMGAMGWVAAANAQCASGLPVATRQAGQ